MQAVTLSPDAVEALAAAFADAMRPRLAYTPQEAAAALGMSRDHFDRHVRQYLRVIRSGQLVRIPKTELERYVAESAERVFDDRR